MRRFAVGYALLGIVKHPTTPISYDSRGRVNWSR